MTSFVSEQNATFLLGLIFRAFHEKNRFPNSFEITSKKNMDDASILLLSLISQQLNRSPEQPEIQLHDNTLYRDLICFIHLPDVHRTAMIEGLSFCIDQLKQLFQSILSNVPYEDILSASKLSLVTKKHNCAHIIIGGDNEIQQTSP